MAKIKSLSTDKTAGGVEISDHVANVGGGDRTKVPPRKDSTSESTSVV